MPTIAVFDGITIMMFYEDHDPPHFHARSASFTAKFAIADLAVLSSQGSLDAQALAKIRRWGRRHEGALLENWFRCQRGERPMKLEGSAR